MIGIQTRESTRHAYQAPTISKTTPAATTLLLPDQLHRNLGLERLYRHLTARFFRLLPTGGDFSALAAAVNLAPRCVRTAPSSHRPTVAGHARMTQNSPAAADATTAPRIRVQPASASTGRTCHRPTLAVATSPTVTTALAELSHVREVGYGASPQQLAFKVRKNVIGNSVRGCAGRSTTYRSSTG